MKDKSISKKVQSGRRFREEVDGPEIRKWHARMPTARLARRMGLKVRQITNYVYRNNLRSWARKLPKVLAALNSKNGRNGGRPLKKIRK